MTERLPETRRVVSVVSDLFFAEKISAVARSVGVVLAGATPDAAVERCTQAPTALTIVDLHGAGDPIGAIRALRADPRTSSIPLVAFYAHVETERRESAIAAGADLVLPRSAFVTRLAGLLSGEFAATLRGRP